MDYDVLQRELLKAIRGKKSQNYLNKRLGYKFNQISRWETGQVQLRWIDFVSLANLCRVNLKECIQKAFGFEIVPDKFELFLQQLFSGKKMTELSTHLKISRFILSRWHSGRTCPSLKDILFVVDKMTPVLVEFVGTFVPIEEIPSLKEQHERKLLEKELNYKYPYLGAVLRCLELKEYKSFAQHKDGYISRTLGISLAEEHLVLQDMLTIQIIKKVAGKFVPKSEHIDARGGFLGLMNIRKYWLGRSLQFANQLSAPPEHSYLGYNVMSVSLKARKEIEEKYFQFFQEVRSIVELDKEAPEEVQILNIQLLALTDMVRAE